MLSNERIAAERLIFRVVAAAAILFAASRLIPQIWDKLSPFIIAIPIAAMLQPLIRFCYRQLKVKRGITSLVLVLLLLGLLYGVLSWFIGFLIEVISPIVNQPENIISSTIATISQAVSSIDKYIFENFPELYQPISESMNNMLGELTDWGADVAKSIGTFIITLAGSLPYIVIYISFLAMALFFISRDYDDIRSYLPGGRRHNQDSSTTRLTNSAIRSLTGYLRVQGIFSLMVLIVSLIFLHAFHFEYASAIAVLAAFLELIPIIGSGLLYILMGIVFFLTNNVPAGVQVLLLTGFLQLVRRILEPKLMSSSIGITPLQSLIGMFVGWRVGGLPGLIGGPVLMSVLVGALRGPSFKSLKGDIRCLRMYFRRRWSPKPEPVPESGAPAPAETPPAEPEPVLPPEQ